MAKVICTHCNKEIEADLTKEADICPLCKTPFSTERAIKLYDKKHVKKRLKHCLYWTGKVLLLILQCIGYLIFALSFVWLFLDITDSLKRKK